MMHKNTGTKEKKIGSCVVCGWFFEVEEPVVFPWGGAESEMICPQCHESMADVFKEVAILEKESELLKERIEMKKDEAMEKRAVKLGKYPRRCRL